MFLWQRLPEPLRLALLPALISFVMLWRALLGLGVFAPTDILLADPVIAQKPPGAVLPTPQNPLLGDVVDTFIPWRLLVRDELSQARFPLWNPYNLVGTHLYANLQSQVLSPFNLIWLVVCEFIALFQCYPISYQWNKSIHGGYCRDLRSTYISISAMAVLTDILVLAPPIWMVAHTTMQRRLKIAVMFLFTLGAM